MQEIDNFRNKSPIWLQPLWDLFEQDIKLGYELTDYGVLKVAPRIPSFIGETNWFHLATPGVDESLLKNIELDLGFRYSSDDVLLRGVNAVTGGYDFDHYIPDFIKEILFATNGFILFGGHLSFSGVQTMDPAEKRTLFGIGPSTEAQMTWVNIWGRPKNIKSKILIFASYPSNGSLVYTEENKKEIFCCDRNGKILYEWADIQTWIREEIIRLSAMFNDTCTLKNPHIHNTHPINEV